MTFSKFSLPASTGQLSLIALAVIASTCAWAEDAAYKGWYAGANVGQSQATIDDDRIIRGLLGSGLATSAINDINRDLGYKVFGGYQFNRGFALEGGYFNLGQFGFQANTVPTGTLTGNIALRGINLDAVGMLPITEKLSAFGRIGVAYTQSNDTFTGTGAVHVLTPNPSTRQANLKVGLGVQYALTDSLLVRAELERYRIDDAVGNKGDIDLASIGLIYRFGAKTPTPAPVSRTLPVAQLAPAPPTVAVAPPPPQAAPPRPVLVPVPVPVPVPLVRSKVSLSADSLFDFDKSSVKPAGRLDLDKFAADLQGVEFDVITVTGHTDRIGTHTYNQKLSERRAAAVNTYLVETAGIAANKISAKGLDGSDPVTKPGDCKGNKVTPALIACLQPDRRVDIEVTGKR